MQNLLILVRTLHFASMFSLAGALAFAAFVAEPAFRRYPEAGDAEAFRRRLSQLVWGSLGLALISGPLWLILEAQNATGGTLAEVCSQEPLRAVLGGTHFGRTLELRGALALPLILCLLIAGRRRSRLAVTAFWAALALSAEELAMIAGAGHAAAEGGWSDVLPFFADAAHLLSAGGWLGGLVPLALLLALARRDPRSSCARAAAEATRRFSDMAMLAIGVILATGVIEAVFLVDSVPRLLGTDYGHLLLIKVALFLTLVAVAALNRRRPRPLRQLENGALVEAGLGGAVLLVLGALTATPPALHAQPHWPLPFRLSLATIAASPQLETQALAAGALALAGLAILGYAVARPRRRAVPLLAGIVLFLATAWWPLRLMTVSAYPTSFYQSTVPFTASSIMRGAQVYAEHCSACHGIGGRGDGTLAKSLPVAPADLAAEHIFGHSDGDLFWWISQGIPVGGMPGFAVMVSESRRWDVINFIHARAAAGQRLALLPQVTAGPARPAPDFVFQRGRQQRTLQQAAAEAPLLLVLYRLPDSLPRLTQLAAAESRLTASGLGLLAISADPPAEDTETTTPLPDFAASAGTEVADAYALFAESDAPGHCEFLIDRAGYLRARWTSAPPDIPALLANLDRLARLPLQEPRAHVHVH